MRRPRRPPAPAAAGRIGRICQSTRDARRLRETLVDELRRSVAFDAYAFLLTDPQTCVGSAPLADVPCRHELPRLIRLKYLTAVNRWTGLGDDGSVALLREVTGGETTRSLLWRELLHQYDVGDVASLVFRDRYGCWGFLDLWRADGGARFDRAEAEFLSRLTDPITRALRRSQAAAFVPRPAPARRVGPVVLLLSPDLEVLGQTPPTLEYLRVLVPPTSDTPPIPAGAYNVAAQLLAVEAGVDANPPMARVHLADGLWLTLRAARIGQSGPDAERAIAVTIEEATAVERVDVFARAFGFSAREAELMDHLVAGRDTRDIAARMYVSEYTVQDHLKSVFAKTDTRNRRTLLSHAIGV